MKTFKQKFDAWLLGDWALIQAACIYGVFCGAVNFLVMRYVS